jgi:protein gp37
MNQSGLETSRAAQLTKKIVVQGWFRYIMASWTKPDNVFLMTAEVSFHSNVKAQLILDHCPKL